MWVSLEWTLSAKHYAMNLVCQSGTQAWSFCFWILFVSVFTCVGVESRFGLGIGRTDWSEDDAMWSLTSLDGQDVGRFNGLVASDKNTYSPRFTTVTGKTPPIGREHISFLLYHICKFSEFRDKRSCWRWHSVFLLHFLLVVTSYHM